MEVDGPTMKGKRKLEDLNCGTDELKPALKCLVKLDYEDADLPI